MKFMINAFVALATLLASAAAIPAVSEKLATRSDNWICCVPIKNPATDKDWASPMPGQGWGPTFLENVKLGIKDLRDAKNTFSVNTGGTPGQCSRVACHRDSVIDLCNESGSPMTRSGGEIADAADFLVRTCTWKADTDSYWTCGQIFKGGWNVAVYDMQMTAGGWAKECPP